MKELFQKIVQSPFSRNVIIASSGSVLAQAITILFSPIITRLYGAEAFGLLGTFTSLVAVLTPIAALTYPIAIVLPRNDENAKGLASLSMRISFIICIIVAVILLIGNERLLGLLNAEEISRYIWLVPLTMFFASWLQVAQQWLIRKKQFAVTAKVAVTKTLISSIAKTVIGWFHPLAAVLIVITTIDNALYAFLLNIGIKRKEGHMLLGRKENDGASLQSLAKRHKDFPLYRAPQAFVNAIAQHFPVLMLAALFGPAAAGFYVLSIRILSIPTEIVSKSVGDVFYPKINEAAQLKQDLRYLILKATLALAAIGFIPYAIIVVFGPVLFGFVFGAEWIDAGIFARWVSIMLFFTFINKPVVASIPVLNLQKGSMIFGFVSAGLKIFALYFGYLAFKTETHAIALFSVVGAIAYIVFIVWVLMSSKNYSIQEQDNSDSSSISNK